MYNVDRVQNNLQRQYWTMNLSPQQVKFGHGGKNSRETHSNNRVVYFSPFSAGQMTMDVSPAAAAVTLINILNCHSCLVWSMDNSAEPWSGPVWMGPHEPGWGWEEVGRDQASIERERERDAAGSELWQISSRPASAEQNNNDLTNHKQTQSCHQQSKIDEFFSSFLQSAQEHILLYFNLYWTCDRPSNKQQHELNKIHQHTFKTVIFSLVMLLGRIRPAF